MNTPHPFAHPETHRLIEELTANTGQTLESIASNPLISNLHKVFGFRWLASLIGEVDTAKIQESIQALKTQYPHDTPEQLTHKVLQQKIWEAGKLGLLTNLIPAFAITLLGIELAGMTKLQAEMVYQIAAIHNYDLAHPSRRGEALALFGLSLSSGGLRMGLNIFDIIPGLAPVIGFSTNAILIGALGLTAHQFYQLKTEATKTP